MFATPFPALRTPARAAWLLCLVIPLGFGALALILGQDANWDLRNYHWYNPYRFLTGRLATDLGASTPYNPLLDVPLYLGGTLLPAKVFSFLLGCIHGLNYVLLYLLARAVLTPVVEPRRTWAAVAIALCGVIGGGHIGLVGTSFHDNVVSLAIIGAMILVVRAPEDVFAGKSWSGYARVGAAGTLLGLGVGLKLPTITFAVGLCFAFLLVAGTFWRRMFLAFWFGIGIIAGMAASCGFWMLHLWQEYQNPIFPYFNNVFKSPLGLQSGNRDVAYVPKTFLAAITFPLSFSFDSHKVGEADFRDFRILAAYLVLLATPVILWLRRARETAPVVGRLAARYVIAACALSFAVWVPLFGIYRYIIPLEMLAPLTVVAVIGLWPVAVQTRALAAGAILLVVTVTARPGDWIRLPAWTEKMVEVSAPPLPDPAHTMILMVGLEPLSYVIPSLPPEMPVVRLQGYFTDPKDDTGMNRLIRERLAAHQGSFYLLSAAWDHDVAVAVLPQFGLSADFSACERVVTNLQPPPDEAMRITLCPVTRTGPAPEHP
ncbi:MAG: hypothetical protein K1X51_06605 [Rhodospirillaceae bacterium]|nr:hypothetical protein [Rhodospirillaceae bacterium]